jgi:hypothetical protein
MSWSRWEYVFEAKFMRFVEKEGVTGERSGRLPRPLCYEHLSRSIRRLDGCTRCVHCYEGIDGR